MKIISTARTLAPSWWSYITVSSNRAFFKEESIKEGLVCGRRDTQAQLLTARLETGKYPSIEAVMINYSSPSHMEHCAAEGH